MRTGVVLDRLEVLALSSGRRIEVTLGDTQVLLIGPPGRPKKAVADEPTSQPERSIERKRKRQREWVAAKRAELAEHGRPDRLLTTTQVAERVGIDDKTVTLASSKGKLRVAARPKSNCPTGYSLRFKWADVLKWRAGVQPYKRAR